MNAAVRTGSATSSVGRCTSHRGQRADLAPELLALPHGVGDRLEELCQAAADLALDRDRHDHEAKIVRVDPIGHRRKGLVDRAVRGVSRSARVRTPRSPVPARRPRSPACCGRSSVRPSVLLPSSGGRPAIGRRTPAAAGSLCGDPGEWCDETTDEGSDDDQRATLTNRLTSTAARPTPAAADQKRSCAGRHLQVRTLDQPLEASPGLGLVKGSLGGAVDAIDLSGASPVRPRPSRPADC